jgi:choline dehydrogenase
MRKAASVFPDPVGAWISTCSPLAIAGQPSACAGVGALKARSNHSLVRGEKTSSGSTQSSVPLDLCSPEVSFDVVIVGGGTAGCVLASRLSESSDRSVCLLEAGPDFGPLDAGGWPKELLDARAIPSIEVWPSGADDERTLGGRVIGGSSSVNACALLEGSPMDYDEWGEGWDYSSIWPHLARAKTTLRAAHANTEHPAPFHRRFIDAAVDAGYPRLADPDDATRPVGVAPYTANAVDGTRWNAAFAYLDPARSRTNLTIRGETPVDRVVVESGRARAVVTAREERIDGDEIVLSAGAYFSPAILMRSGVGPEDELTALGIRVEAQLPVGETLLDHCGTDVSWEPSELLRAEIATHVDQHGLFQPYAVLKAESSRSPQDTWDLHLLSWVGPREAPGSYEVFVLVFDMKPLSSGRVRLRSKSPKDMPLVERGFLTRDEDVATLVEGIEIARAIASEEPLGRHLAHEHTPGSVDAERYVRETVRNYFHPAATCALGKVVDAECRVLGIESLRVVDASVMPTLPRANTNLTTAAIAEKIAARLA